MILPGAAYPEQSGLYVNTEGRVQMAMRAGFPPGEAREDWAILRALSAELGAKLPFDSLDQLRRQLVAEHPHLAGLDRIAEPTGAPCRPARWATAPLRSTIRIIISPTRSPGRARSWPSSAGSRASGDDRAGGGVRAMRAIRHLQRGAGHERFPRHRISAPSC